MPTKIIPRPIAFDWDRHNIDKNQHKHQVEHLECEQAFFNHPQIIFEDISHSQTEPRYTLLGSTNHKRQLHITFTIRKNCLRVISARDQNKKERIYYEKSRQN